MKNLKPKIKHVRTNKQRDTKMISMVTCIKPKKKKFNTKIQATSPQQLTTNETKNKKNKKERKRPWPLSASYHFLFIYLFLFIYKRKERNNWLIIIFFYIYISW